jgi:hypothetical protein
LMARTSRKRNLCRHPEYCTLVTSLRLLAGRGVGGGGCCFASCPAGRDPFSSRERGGRILQFLHSLPMVRRIAVIICKRKILTAATGAPHDRTVFRDSGDAGVCSCYP